MKSGNSFVPVFQAVLEEQLFSTQACKFVVFASPGEYRVTSNPSNLGTYHEITVSCRLRVVTASRSQPTNEKTCKFRVVIATADDFRYLDEIRPMLEGAAREICETIYGLVRGEYGLRTRKYVRQVIEDSDGSGRIDSPGGPSGPIGVVGKPLDATQLIRPLADDLRRAWKPYVSEVLSTKPELESPRIGFNGTAPSEPKLGSLWFNTDKNIMYIWDGSGWQEAKWNSESWTYQTEDGLVQAGARFPVPVVAGDKNAEIPKLGARKLQIDE